MKSEWKDTVTLSKHKWLPLVRRRKTLMTRHFYQMTLQHGRTPPQAISSSDSCHAFLLLFLLCQMCEQCFLILRQGFRRVFCARRTDVLCSSGLWKACNIKDRSSIVWLDRMEFRSRGSWTGLSCIVGCLELSLSQMPCFVLLIVP